MKHRLRVRFRKIYDVYPIFAFFSSFLSVFPHISLSFDYSSILSRSFGRSIFSIFFLLFLPILKVSFVRGTRSGK